VSRVFDLVSLRERVTIGAVCEQTILDRILVPEILHQEQARDDESEGYCQPGKRPRSPVVVLVVSQRNLPPGTGNYGRRSPQRPFRH
jgi:hypothetical protein